MLLYFRITENCLEIKAKQSEKYFSDLNNDKLVAETIQSVKLNLMF